MIKFNNFKVFGFVIVLIGAITFASINFLEAKKASPGESWKEKISGCGECSSSQLQSYNALSPSNTCYWAKTYGCDKDGDTESWRSHHTYYSIQQTRDGGYILADGIHPEDNPEEYSDVWVLKLDAEGVIDWHRCYGGDLIERYPYIGTTADGGYIVSSSVCSPSYDQYDIWIFKLNSKGDIQWQKIYGGSKSEEALSIHQTRDGGYIVTGYTKSFGLGGVLVLKLDSAGDIEWQRVYEGGRENSAIQPTSDGGYIVISGITIDGNEDVWVIKLDANGYSQWQRTYGGSGPDYGNLAIQETNDGGYIMNCFTDTFCATWAIWILKLTRKGEIEWQKTYDGNSSDWSNSIRQTNDGGYIFGGGTISFGAGLPDILVLKLNPYGSIEWQRTYGESYNDLIFSIHQTDDNSYILGGWSRSYDDRIFMMKIPSDGDIDAYCGGLTDIPNMTTSDTFVTPRKTNIAPVNSSLVSYDTNIQPEEINAFEEFVCWNLNQAPVNVSLERDVNRSVFTKEAFYIISWSPNPANDQFNITQYRIYRAEAASERYELLGVVSGDIFEYVDGYLDLNDTFYYAVTSIDSEGNESPKSSPAKGGYSVE
jgi:hypothetical protein